MRPPGTASVVTTVFCGISTTVTTPASRAATYINGFVGWNAIPVRRLPTLLAGMFPVVFNGLGVVVSMPWGSNKEEKGLAAVVVSLLGMVGGGGVVILDTVRRPPEDSN